MDKKGEWHCLATKVLGSFSMGGAWFPVGVSHLVRPMPIVMFIYVVSLNCWCALPISVPRMEPWLHFTWPH